MPILLSVNAGQADPTVHADAGVTGIDKRPVAGAVEIRDPGPPGGGGSGLVGDAVCDRKDHGGRDQAVYAYAREDLDAWQAELGRPLTCGVFGENLTTHDLEVNRALIGERWRIGADCVLQVCAPRIPCRTFAAWVEEREWVRRFTLRGAPGAYLRVVSRGRVRAGDPIEILSRPDHDVTVKLMFRALTREKKLIPSLAPAGDALPEGLRLLLESRR